MYVCWGGLIECDGKKVIERRDSHIHLICEIFKRQRAKRNVFMNELLTFAATHFSDDNTSFIFLTVLTTHWPQQRRMRFDDYFIRISSFSQITIVVRRT